MLVLHTNHIRAWDDYTIKHEPVSSIDLMERAATEFTEALCKQFQPNVTLLILCGRGNNGGDGLAIARQLLEKGWQVKAFVMEGSSGSADFLQNFERLKSITEVSAITDSSMLPNETGKHDIVVDALLGTGLNKVPEGIYAATIEWMNKQDCPVVSVDLPSGLQADDFTPHDCVVRATLTFTFQAIKRCMLMPECESFVGAWRVLDIGLHPAFLNSIKADAFWVENPWAYVERKSFSRFAHKGIRGHALLAAGSNAMMGAALLAAQACLKSGCGLVTLATESQGWPVVNGIAPEVICASPQALTNGDFLEARRIKALGIGPGWLASDEHVQGLAWLIECAIQPLVMDATALRILKSMLPRLPQVASLKPCLITPHVGEFDDLFGASKNHFDRWELAREAASKYKLAILLKGCYSRLFMPDGQVWVNATGNAGMAKGGSGDVLMGLITGLIATGYSIQDAAILGAWLHGEAGDLAAGLLGEEAMQAGDIVRQIPEAWKRLTPS